jgi:hypothetical protein
MGTFSGIIMGLLTTALLSVLITEAYAQTPPLPTPASPMLTATTQQIISEVQTACDERTSYAELVFQCVSVVHESPTTLVLQGNLLLLPTQIGGDIIDNFFIWQAVDRFKAQGYSLTSVQLAGQGTQPNPHIWYIVMSK